ncbi:MAG: deoxyhypusine synthase [Planctomycetota bacterium]|nr:MAG: deoxyhypusine synthase [Planctomycetota bacterium]
MRKMEDLADGWQHKLRPLKPFDVRSASTASQMLQQYSDAAFGARSLGQAAEVLHEMVADRDCFVVGTFSGAMTVAKMGLLITEMIEQGMLNAVVSTGALVCHGLIEQTGNTHFRYEPGWSDEELFEAGYDRVYDTLELEKNLYSVERTLISTLKSMDQNEPFGSRDLLRRIGEQLNEAGVGPGILQAAARRDVPVYVPAFTDSELGLDVFVHNVLARMHVGDRRQAQFDPMRDLGDYYERVKRAKRLGIFTIGGGVPRNWAQQVGPLGEILYHHTEGDEGSYTRFRYGVRICPEPVHWGGLSGCTYSEGISWGKFVPPKDGGRFAEVYCDATIAWPLLVRAVLERMDRV